MVRIAKNSAFNKMTPENLATVGLNFCETDVFTKDLLPSTPISLVPSLPLLIVNVATFMALNVSNRAFLQFFIENGEEFLNDPAMLSPLSTPLASPRLSATPHSEMAAQPIRSAQTEPILPKISDILEEPDEQAVLTPRGVDADASKRLLQLAGFQDTSQAPPALQKRVDQLLDFIDFIDEATGNAESDKEESEDSDKETNDFDLPSIQVEEPRISQVTGSEFKSKYITLEKGASSLLRVGGAEQRRRSSSSVMNLEPKLTTLEVQLLIILDNAEGSSSSSSIIACNKSFLATKAFAKFLDGTMCGENLHFWLEVRQWKLASKQSASTLRAQAQAIYEKYIVYNVRWRMYLLILKFSD